MNTFQVSQLKDNTYFTQELGLDKSFLLLNPLLPYTNELRNFLVKWEFKTVCSEGDIGIAQNPLPMEEVSEEKETSKSVSQLISDSIKKVLSEAKQDIIDNNEKSRLEIVQTVYNEYLNYITAVYTRYATHKELNYEDISDTVKELCIFIKENKRYVLRINPVKEIETSKDFLINHSLRSTVLAIVIGLQIRIPLSKLIELGVACLLHEIGQIRLPPQLYITQRRLNESEKVQLSTHTIIGFNILKDNNFPLPIQLGVLQHHERENGSGYPRRLSSSSISLYAKIISVACSYEAITAPRHYKTQKTSYDAMVEMLRNKDKAYDDTIIKALLLCVSLFPIGAYVELSNGKFAQVIDIIPGDPRNPVVQILNEKDDKGQPVTVNTNQNENRITRVLKKEEVESLLKQSNDD